MPLLSHVPGSPWLGSGIKASADEGPGHGDHHLLPHAETLRLRYFGVFHLVEDEA